ncbi:MAG: hypothetical protein KGJ58_00645 [Patescibacteria group bacterium]|nr:hypothetical protein [Patescibacteria group bacterium]MDE1988591.1 hypothetical protein [Patescibacteria group bacterium]MDE2217951.1 hypothetical protein [Patescibacteria group bacterium]
MKILIRNIFTGLSLFALVLFAGNGFLIGQVRAQAQTTSAAPITQENTASEFKRDVERDAQEVKNDEDAQNNQQEIDSEDDEKAGDDGGDAKEIDGENDQNKIDSEIDQEAEMEDGTDGSMRQSRDEESQGGSETADTEASASSDDEGN